MTCANGDGETPAGHAHAGALLAEREDPLSTGDQLLRLDAGLVERLGEAGQVLRDPAAPGVRATRPWPSGLEKCGAPVTVRTPADRAEGEELVMRVRGGSRGPARVPTARRGGGGGRCSRIGSRPIAIPRLRY